MTEGFSPVIPKREDAARAPVEFTAAEQDRVAQLLEKRLGKDELSTRAGPRGSSLTYLESQKAIELANYIFSYNGWCSQVQNITVDFVDETRDRCTVGLSVLMRITLKDGTFHEDIGYGSAQMSDKCAALEKAKKEAVSDARKRTLRLFGSALGNCVYDKQYVKDIRTGHAVSERIIPAPRRPGDPIVKPEPSTPVSVPAFPSFPQTPQTPASFSVVTTTSADTTTPRPVFSPPPYSNSPSDYNPNLQNSSTPSPNSETRSSSSSCNGNSTSVNTPRTPKFPPRNGSNNSRSGSCGSGKNGGSNSGGSCKASNSCGRGSGSSSGRGSGSGNSSSKNPNANNCNSGSGSRNSGCMNAGGSSSFGGHGSGTSGVSVSSGSCGNSCGGMNSGFSAGNSNYRPQGSGVNGSNPVGRGTGCVNGSGFGSSSSFPASVGGCCSSSSGVGSSSCSSTSGSMLSNGSCGVNSCSGSCNVFNNSNNHNSLVSHSNDNNNPDNGSNFSPNVFPIGATNLSSFNHDNQITEADLEGFDFDLLANNSSRNNTGVHFNKENFDPSIPFDNRTSNSSFGPSSTIGYNTGAAEGGLKRNAGEAEDSQGQKRGRV